MIERYTLPEMGKIWEEEFKFNVWLKIESLACEARYKMGEIPESDFEEIKSKAKFDVKRIIEIEQTVKHDVIAFLTNVAEYVGAASRHIHYGMTSSDVLDTALCYQMKIAGELLLKNIEEFGEILKEKALQNKNVVCVGRTHGVHAEATTMGLKFALWHQENERNIARLKSAIENISVGKISGAVGTYEHLSPAVEEYVCEKLGLKPAPISTQIIQRDRHAFYMSTLALIGASLEKIALEIRHLQKTETLEAEEYFSKGQKGSSAMPHKRNPIISERICGISRLLRANAFACFENVALWHERDISHSSVERVAIPDSCIILHYAIHLAKNLIKNLIIYPDKMLENLNLTRGLIFSQKVLLALAKKGMTREDAYAAVQDCAMKTWQDKSTNLSEELKKSEIIKKHLTSEEIDEIFDFDALLQNVDYIYKRLNLI